MLPTALGGPSARWGLIGVKPDQEHLRGLAALVEQGACFIVSAEVTFLMVLLLCVGKVRPLVDSVFAFEDALKAYERLATNRATGKVVIKVDANVQ